MLYLDLIERANSEDISCVLIETLRDAERQQFYLTEGVSWTKRSKHLPQPPNGLSLAFDLAEKYRMIAMVILDGSIGQMMEPI